MGWLGGWGGWVGWGGCGGRGGWFGWGWLGWFSERVEKVLCKCIFHLSMKHNKERNQKNYLNRNLGTE